jgi:hypothetical protein
VTERNRHKNLEHALDYLARLAEARIRLYLGQSEGLTVDPPDLVEDGSPLYCFLHRYRPDYREFVTLLVALIPTIRPAFLDDLFGKHFAAGQHHPGIGGFRGKQHRGFLPTGELVQFLIAGKDLHQRVGTATLFGPNHWFARDGILRLLPPPPGEPPMAGQLVADPDFVDRILYGRSSLPAFSPAFPAQRLETELDWSDLVLPERSLAEIDYLRHYLDHREVVSGSDGYGRHNRRGYRALFHGPPGTGKTLTAALLGKVTERPVFRVDLSMVVSKYIGETEKNLAGLFSRAEHKGWILFFDEADALFSKRGEVKESRDKYANQETSFLLQRVEHYDGLCILATNHRRNMDAAFTRRFEAIVPFQLPSVEERLRLWRTIWPTALPPAPDLDVERLARRYDLTGAHIANILRHCTYEAVARGAQELNRETVVAAVGREYAKEDRLPPK